MTDRPSLVGDGIENPGNAQVLRNAAAMFGWDAVFHDRCGLADAWGKAGLGEPPSFVLREGIESFSPIIAVENSPGAESIFGFRAPPGLRLAVVVGNERRGITRDLLQLADRTVEIPLASRTINTINVAAAAAIAAYFISRGGGGRLHVRADPQQHRPDVLVMGPTDAIELGSALRTAAAFGWIRIFVEDRANVWFETDRVTKSIGRGAARRGRNAIQIVPTTRDRRYAFEEAIFVTARGDGETLHRVDLARGSEQLVVLADEGGVALADEDLGRLARSVRVARLDLPTVDFRYRLRLVASIALAEVTRQVGVRQRPGRGRPRPPIYDTALRVMAEEHAGAILELQDLPL